MANRKKELKSKLRILLHIGNFFWILAFLTCVLIIVLPKVRNFVDEQITVVTCNPLPPDDLEKEEHSENSSLTDNQQKDILEAHASKWGLYFFTFAGIGSIFLIIYYMIKLFKKIISGNQKEETDTGGSKPKAFDPSGLYSTTTPLTPGSQYGSKDEVSVTSPLNNGYYFQIVEELKFLGSDEIIQ